MENKENNFNDSQHEEDLYDLDEREVEMDLKEFVNSSHKLNRNTEYIIQNKYGDTYCLNYDLNADNGNFKILYFEHHYTKFWNRNIQAKEYLKLKIKFAKKYYNNIETRLESEDDCHPTLVLSLLCNENEVIKMVESLEKLHEDFDKRCDVLENEIEKLISNFEL